MGELARCQGRRDGSQASSVIDSATPCIVYSSCASFPLDTLASGRNMKMTFDFGTSLHSLFIQC